MTIKIRRASNYYTPNCYIINKVQDIFVENDVKVFFVNRFGL